MKRILLISLMLASANASAALSKWVDANGKVHYSDEPPPANVKSETLRVPSAPAPMSASGVAAASGTAAPKTVAEREAELKKAQRAKKEAADKAAQEQARMETVRANCETMRENLRALQEGMRMVEVDTKGERSYLSDEQRRQRIEKIQQNIQEYCK